MSHTQCDATQRSRFELWGDEQWGHHRAGGINLPVPWYNTVFLINGGNCSRIWKGSIVLGTDSVLQIKDWALLRQWKGNSGLTAMTLCFEYRLLQLTTVAYSPPNSLQIVNLLYYFLPPRLFKCLHASYIHHTASDDIFHIFPFFSRLSTISVCCNTIIPRPLLNFLLTGLLL